MQDALTMAEIEQRCPDQWVLIAQPRRNEVEEILAGRVVVAGEDLDSIEAAARSLRLTSSALLFTGHMLPDVGYIL